MAAANQSEVPSPEQHAPAATRRFVVLEHDSPRGRHWDLMLELEGRLRTWALAQPPDAPRTIPAEALPDHRLVYLEYEGPISGGRGQVRRWDAGAYQPLLPADPNQAEEVYLLQGERLQGRAILLPPTPPSSEWQFRFEPG
ncbi:MAG TPA: DNA polymerase ligase N-terminal domain-containing protein [Thermoguttaceae bacterium]|nr:DNA polymerase ligase N-terminal domain-containing protein [Thermoguttaceae bacterium]